MNVFDTEGEELEHLRAAVKRQEEDAAQVAKFNQKLRAEVSELEERFSDVCRQRDAAVEENKGLRELVKTLRAAPSRANTKGKRR